ncbi:hypothetical protein HYC85_026095 [Camellia sinensis]|uniref:Uncharacterized protein n=1 Tax=Camellia sinensis TaxID=4442 RepID=A0A7J7G6M5_CAMSI|nr:hypothetical protein HYC85_026095 [Camellia sinensis]
MPSCMVLDSVVKGAPRRAPRCSEVQGQRLTPPKVRRVEEGACLGQATKGARRTTDGALFYLLFS